MDFSADRAECLILDLFGVIVSFDDRLVYDRIAQYCADPGNAARSMTDLVSDQYLIRGKSSLEEVHCRLVSELGFDASYRDFESMWLAPYSEPMPGMRELLRDLAGSYRLVLLSNVDRYYWDTVRASVPELENFHARALSFEEGVAKPERQSFLRAIDKAGVPVERCVFVDDKTENINAAISVGLAGHLFETTLGLKHALREEKFVHYEDASLTWR